MNIRHLVCYHTNRQDQPNADIRFGVSIPQLTKTRGTSRALAPGTDPINLPEPQTDGNVSVEKALAMRSSIREFRKSSLSLSQISQLLWACQGVNRSKGQRTTPSAGALYPLEIILVAGDIQDLKPGIYRYCPKPHALEPLHEGNKRDELAAAALDQDCVRYGAATIIITCIPERITVKYGQRGYRYIHMESGHAAQNIYLQAAALGLGTVVVGAFHDRRIQQILQLPEFELPLYILPVGYPA